MKKSKVIRRVREKLIKLHSYNLAAQKLYGTEIAKDMFNEDLDFLTTLLAILEKDTVDAE